MYFFLLISLFNIELANNSLHVIYPCHLEYISPSQGLSLWNLRFLEIKATHQELVLYSAQHTF